MVHYKIARFSYYPLCTVSFCSILFFCEILGIGFSLLERDWLGIVSGALFGILLGASGSFLTLIFLFVYNTLVPLTGGLSMHLTLSPPNETAISLPNPPDNAEE